MRLTRTTPRTGPYILLSLSSLAAGCGAPLDEEATAQQAALKGPIEPVPTEGAPPEIDDGGERLPRGFVAPLPCAGNARRIAFTSYDVGGRGDADIYTLCPDGSDLKRLTYADAYDGAASWTLDHSMLVYASIRTHSAEVRVMNADGSGNRAIHPVLVDPGQPSFSPDGGRVAYGAMVDGRYAPLLVPIDTGFLGAFPLPPGHSFMGQPQWSPDGGQLAYVSRNGVSTNIWVANLDGTMNHRVTYDGGERDPAWSPDGRDIAFSRTVSFAGGPPAEPHAFVASSGGSPSLTFLGKGTQPTWSPDGRELVVSAPVFNRPHPLLVRVKRDGTGRTYFPVGNRSNAFEPAWNQ